MEIIPLDFSYDSCIVFFNLEKLRLILPESYLLDGSRLPIGIRLGISDETPMVMLWDFSQCKVPWQTMLTVTGYGSPY